MSGKKNLEINVWKEKSCILVRQSLSWWPHHQKVWTTIDNKLHLVLCQILSMFKTLRESFHSIMSSNMYMSTMFSHLSLWGNVTQWQHLHTQESMYYYGSSCPHNLQYCILLYFAPQLFPLSNNLCIKCTCGMHSYVVRFHLRRWYI